MARRYRCPLVLGSATPSPRPSTAAAAARIRRHLDARRDARAPGTRSPADGSHCRPAPRVRTRQPLHVLKTADGGLERVVERREKAVLLHNRRGFAPFLMCRECGCVPTCNHCSTALTYHERTHTLQCHTCGSSGACSRIRAHESLPQVRQPLPGKNGSGYQQIEDALHQMLPEDVAIIRMDADSTRGKDAHKKLLEQFDAADCAVLLGTQMIAKGLDFPEVTLVGVVNADFALKLPDFRAGERAYDLLEQVAGRAGRGDRPGEVIIQTYLPDDPVIRAVAEHDRSIFTDYDLDQRRDALYPPFVRLVNILVWSTNAGDARDYIGRIAKLLKRRWHAAAPDFLRAGSAVPQVLGPASCVIERAKDRYRFHLLVKSPVGYHVSDDIDACLKEVGSVRGVSVSVDVDAYDLM
ncbi:MAG: primosomal protein N' [Collinsella sp.]